MEQCGFFDAHLEGTEYDRVYLAQSFADYFASFIANGVYAAHSNQLQVMSLATPQMAVSVESGQGWINGYWYENTDSLQLSIDVADGVLNRIDAIVLRLGYIEREIWLAVKKGTPATNPIAPTVTRSSDYFELQLATVNVPAGSTRITQSQIVDTRMNTSVCGWVTGVIQQIDTTTLFEQFQAYFEEFKITNEAEFAEWFEHMKGQLSEDAAGQLQLEIDDLSDDITQLTSEIDDLSDEVDSKVSKSGDTMTGNLTVPRVIGNVTGNVTGNASGNVLKSGDTMTGLLKIDTNGSEVTIGAANSSFCHFNNTKNVPFYFGRPITINGALNPHTDNSFSLGSGSARWKLNGSTVGDVITEAGTINAAAIPAQSALAATWKYFKLASGRVIAYGTATWTGVVSTVWGNIYEGAGFRLALPQALGSSIPTVGIYHAHSYNSGCWLEVYQTGTYQLSPVLCINRATSAASEAYYIKAILMY